mgnify:CR=1 FL=1
MNRNLTIMQVKHPLDKVVDQRHSEIPIQLNSDIFQDFLQCFRAVLVENEDVGTWEVNASAYESNCVLVINIAGFLDLPEECRVDFNLVGQKFIKFLGILKDFAYFFLWNSLDSDSFSMEHSCCDDFL